MPFARAGRTEGANDRCRQPQSHGTTRPTNRLAGTCPPPRLSLRPRARSASPCLSSTGSRRSPSPSASSACSAACSTTSSRCARLSRGSTPSARCAGWSSGSSSRPSASRASARKAAPRSRLLLGLLALPVRLRLGLHGPRNLWRREHSNLLALLFNWSLVSVVWWAAGAVTREATLGRTSRASSGGLWTLLADSGNAR